MQGNKALLHKSQIKRFKKFSKNLFLHKDVDIGNKNSQIVFEKRWKHVKFKKKNALNSRYKIFWKNNFSKSLKKIKNLFKNNDYIADFGGGTGISLISLLSSENILKKNFIVNDISLNNIKIYQENLKLIKSNLTYGLACEFRKIPIKTRSLNLIFAIGSIHHDTKPNKTLIKILSFLEVGGCLVMWVYRKQNIIRTELDLLFRRLINFENKIKSSEILHELTKFAKEINNNNCQINLNSSFKNLGIKKGKYKLSNFIYKYLFRSTFNRKIGFKNSFYENLDWYGPLNNYCFSDKEIESLISKKFKVEFKNISDSGISYIIKRIKK